MKKIITLLFAGALIGALHVSCKEDKPIENPTIAVTGVTVEPIALAIVPGASVDLTATVEPANATDKTVTWSSASTSIATVDPETGRVTAVAEGVAIITVTTTDGKKTATCTVTVSEDTVSVTGVTVTPEQATIEVGETIMLEAQVAPENATEQGVVWSSEDETRATVDPETGEVTAVAEGEVSIVATTVDGNITDNCVVTVVAAPYRIVSAAAFFDKTWNQMDSFILHLFGYERDAAGMRIGEGYYSYLRILSDRFDESGAEVDIPEGEYPFSEFMSYNTVFLGADQITDMISGVEWRDDGGSEARLLRSGHLTVSRTEAGDYRFDVEFNFLDDTDVKARYEGPMIIMHPDHNSTLTAGVSGITLTQGTVYIGYPNFTGVTRCDIKLLGEGLSLDSQGRVQGSGHYLFTQINIQQELLGLDEWGFELFDQKFKGGTYTVAVGNYTAGTADRGQFLRDVGQPYDGRTGSWYFEFEDGVLVAAAPLRDGTVTFSDLDSNNHATASVRTTDGEGHAIEVDFDGGLEVTIGN